MDVSLATMWDLAREALREMYKAYESIRDSYTSALQKV